MSVKTCAIQEGRDEKQTYFLRKGCYCGVVALIWCDHGGRLDGRTDSGVQRYHGERSVHCRIYLSAL